MPGREKELGWARNMAGVVDVMDLSLPMIEKAESIKLFHRFFLHSRNNPVTEEQLAAFKQKIDASLTDREQVWIRMVHGASKAHRY